VKRSDYPGHDLPRKELHKRLLGAYQLAGRLLMDPLDDPKEVRDEAIIVLLDFLSDPATADVDRLAFAARGFQALRKVPADLVTTGGTSAGDIRITDVRMTS
jgi:hypothetical protein